MATLNDVNIENPVAIYPAKTEGFYSVPFEDEMRSLSSENTKRFIEQLERLDKLGLIESTLQGLAKRDDGTLLKTAFPNVDEVLEVICFLPDDIQVDINRWVSEGASEINFDFEELEAGE
jgi:hypothetical protein